MILRRCRGHRNDFQPIESPESALILEPYIVRDTLVVVCISRLHPAMFGGDHMVMEQPPYYLSALNVCFITEKIMKWFFIEESYSNFL